MSKYSKWKCNDRTSWFQLTGTFITYIGLILAAYQAYDFHFYLAIIASIAAGLVLVRLFILQHDCAHHSFFTSHWLNRRVGLILGAFTLVPHHYWRRMHILHHGSSGDLNRRGWGDILTLTVNEYHALSPIEKIKYQIYRNPIAILLFGPLYQFVLRFRWPGAAPAQFKKERLSIVITNFLLLALHLAAFICLNYTAFLIISLIITQVSAMIGIALFYVQHQIEEPYWTNNNNWSAQKAALHGSTHFRLPLALEWFLCSINLHHVHHLKPGIVNYRLREYMIESGLENAGHTIYPRDVIPAFQLKLYDELTGAMVGFEGTKLNMNNPVKEAA